MKAYCMKKAAQVFRKTKVAAATFCVGAVGFAAMGPALGQTTIAPSERAKRDAEKVFSWMKLQTVDTKKPNAPVVVPAKEEKPVVAAKPANKPAPKSEATVVASNDTRAAELAQTLESAPTAAGVAAAEAASVAAAGLAAPAATMAIPEPEVEEPIQLVPIAASQPEFPAALMQKLRQGRVQVAFDIQPDGTVADVRVVSSTSQRLNRFVVAAVEEWRFQPIRRTQTAGTEFYFEDAEE